MTSGAADAAAGADAAAPRGVRATGPARRQPLALQGLLPALLGGALVAASVAGTVPLAALLVVAQLFLVLGLLALLDAPAGGGAFALAAGATVAADGLVLLGDGDVGPLAGVVALALVASLLHQLARRGRTRVTEALADTLLVVVVSVSAACLLALRQLDGGDEAVAVSLGAAAAALLAGRLGDLLAPRPALATGSTRGWPGLLLGLGAGVAAAVVASTAGDVLGGTQAALLGLLVAATAATADLLVDLGAAELRGGWRDARRVAALRPVALLLPYCLLGPVALLAGRLVLP